MSLILTELMDSIGTIVINNPERRNALSEALNRQIIDALERFRAEKVRVVVLRAPQGAKIWSAGHDVNELPKSGRDPLAWSDPMRTLVRAIEDFPAPLIALIEGGVWGGACEVAMACDILIATPNATFAITPAKLGIPYPFTGLLTFLNAVPLAVVREMAFTARPISAERAERLGMVNHVVPAEDIDRFVYDMAHGIAANAPLSVSVMKEELRLLASAHAMTPRMFERAQGLREIAYDSEDYQEGVRAFLEKRPPTFKGK